MLSVNIFSVKFLSVVHPSIFCPVKKLSYKVHSSHIQFSVHARNNVVNVHTHI